MPIAFVISLIIEVKRFRKFSIVVKSLDSVELLSSLSVCVSDKTGTLTQNRAHVASIIYGHDELSIYKEPASMIQLLAACYMCNNYRQNLYSNSIDCALHEFTERKVIHLSLDSMYQVVNEIDFKSVNRFQIKLVKPKNLLMHNLLFGNLTQKESLLLVKGAPDVLKIKCKYIIDTRICLNEEKKLSESIVNRIADIQDSWSNMGKRCLLICKKVIKDSDFNKIDDFEKYFKMECNDLTIIGLVGLCDPPREGLHNIFIFMVIFLFKF